MDDIKTETLDLADLSSCKGCGGTIAPVFYRLHVQQVLIDQRSVVRHAGLALMLGSGGLADAMGTGIAAHVMQEGQVIFCSRCAAEHIGLALMALGEKDSDKVAENEGE